MLALRREQANSVSGLHEVHSSCGPSNVRRDASLDRRILPSYRSTVAKVCFPISTWACIRFRSLLQVITMRAVSEARRHDLDIMTPERVRVHSTRRREEKTAYDIHLLECHDKSSNELYQNQCHVLFREALRNRRESLDPEYGQDSACNCRSPVLHVRT